MQLGQIKFVWIIHVISYCSALKEICNNELVMPWGYLMWFIVQEGSTLRLNPRSTAIQARTDAKHFYDIAQIFT